MVERTIGTPATSRTTTAILSLDDDRAADPALGGAKAANIVAMARSGLPTLPGFVITTGVTSTARTPEGRDLLDDPTFKEELEARWRALSSNGRQAIVVRSSSTVEDSHSSSLAGLFESVLDVRTWDAFTSALARVLASRSLPRLGDVDALRTSGMGVLVQRQVDVDLGGVAFGADPVERRADRVLVAAVRGTPDRLVSGKTSGVQYRLSRRGRLVETLGDASEAPLSASQRRKLVGLVKKAAAVFDGPQDIEWAIDRDGALWVLQSRPITTSIDMAAPSGPVLGPGPVAETFPHALYPLEEDLWLPPLGEALVAVLSLVGARSRKRLEASPGVVSVGGRAAIDLELSGVIAGRRPSLAYLRPLWTGRRMATAWRVGRLRAALPDLADDVLRVVDTALGDVPSLADCSDDELLRILERGHAHLVSLHGHEMLAGSLMTTEGAAAPTAPGEALSVLRRARRLGLDDEAIVTRHPVVLALTAPAIHTRPLPATRQVPTVPGPAGPASSDGTPGRGRGAGRDADQLALSREALRMRVRWVQELEALAARALGTRLYGEGLLRAPEDVQLIHLDELRRVVHDGAAVPDLEGRDDVTHTAPLPAAFRLTPDGTPVPESTTDERQAVGAVGGRAKGRVHIGGSEPDDGAVLVVRTLDPDLAAWLPRISALVSETGSPLSHLAILAREQQIPTVVGAPDATTRLVDDDLVLVDGTTGEVRRLDAHEPEVPDRTRQGHGDPGNHRPERDSQ